MMPLLRNCFILLVLLCCFLESTAVLAQTTEPDTVRRKRELPTGPTVEPQQQRQPRVTQPQPEVIRPQVVRPGQEEPESFLDRMFWGGSFGLQLGTFTNISLLPVLGYRVTDTFWMGTGAVYHYRRFRGESIHNYGGRLFAQQQVFNNFLIHGEYEAVSVEYPTQVGPSAFIYDRRFIGLPMAGLGYRQRIGERGAADLLLLYNFNDSFASPYSNPIFRAGFSFPFRR